jgi:putative ABC transport system substrate-binding protein
VAAFRQGLSETGYAEHRTVGIEHRWAEGQYDRLPALARELVRWPVDLIAAMDGIASALAAKAATTTLPIVFQMGDDPVQYGLVASLNRPGGNLTVSFLTPALEAKRVELLHKLTPKADQIVALVNPSFPKAEARTSSARAAASTLGLQFAFVNASSGREIEEAFATIAECGPAAVIVTSDPFFFRQREQLVALAARYAVPTAYNSRDFARAGGLLSYGADITDTYRQVGIYTGRILKGTKPADLPVPTTNQVRVCDRSQDRQDTWSGSAADAARPRRRGDRMKLPTGLPPANDSGQPQGPAGASGTS